jgi:hypothetical protein
LSEDESGCAGAVFARLPSVAACGAALAAALALASAAVPARAQTLDVPPGVRIPASLSDRVSSQDAAPGDVFHFTTAAPAQVGGRQIPAGTPGHGFVRLASPATKSGPGELDLQAASLDLQGGGTIAVTLTPQSATVRGPLYHTHFWPFPLPFIGVGVVGTATRGDRNATLLPGAKLTLVTGTPSPAPAATPGER